MVYIISHNIIYLYFTNKMKYSLGISSKKIASIVFLLITLVIALLLSGIPMFVSTHPATIPLSKGIIQQENFQPTAVIVEEKTEGTPIAVQPKVFEDTSKVFNHLTGLKPQGEQFNVIRNF